MDYRYGSHTVFQIEYHFVWVTKYRYKVLTGEVAERVRELVRQVCATFEIRIVKGVVSKDDVQTPARHGTNCLYAKTGSHTPANQHRNRTAWRPAW